MLETVPPNVSGVNFVVETLNVWSLPVGLNSVIVNEVGWPTVTRPKLAETGSSHVVPWAATERFSRPAPCAVGPMSCRRALAAKAGQDVFVRSEELLECQGGAGRRRAGRTKICPFIQANHDGGEVVA